MAREVTEASSSPDKLNAYIAKTADPDPTDNIIPELRQVKGGWGIFYGKDLLKGTQLYADTKAVPGFQALAMDMIAKAKGNPMGWTIQKLAIDKDLAAINASNASAGASNASAAASGANVGLTNARADQIKTQNKILDANVANNEKARELLTQMAALDFDADPAAPQKLASLQAQFNVANAPPGKAIPVGGNTNKKTSILEIPVLPAVKNDNGTQTIYAKDGGKPLYLVYNGLPIPLGMKPEKFDAMEALAVKNGVALHNTDDDGRLGLAYVGPDGKPYSDPEKAKRSKAPAPEKAAAVKSGIDTSKSATAKVSPDEAPPVKERLQLGKKRYTIEGLPRVYNSEAEAKKAWAEAQTVKNKNKLSFSDTSAKDFGVNNTQEPI